MVGGGRPASPHHRQGMYARHRPSSMMGHQAQLVVAHMSRCQLHDIRMPDATVVVDTSCHGVHDFEVQLHVCAILAQTCP